MKNKGFYRLLSPLGGDCVRLVFDGPWQGETVLWDARLYTRLAYGREHHGAVLAGNMIDVGDLGAEGRTLTVVLDVPAIDQPTVLKTLHMIRQWKRLGPGRHVFGGKR